MSKKDVHVKGKAELEQAIGYLEDVVASLKQRALHIQNGSRGLSLQPQQLVEFEVEASSKGDKESLQLSLSWRKQTDSEPELALSISSEPPAEEKVEAGAEE